MPVGEGRQLGSRRRREYAAHPRKRDGGRDGGCGVAHGAKGMRPFQGFDNEFPSVIAMYIAFHNTKLEKCASLIGKRPQSLRGAEALTHPPRLLPKGETAVR